MKTCPLLFVPLEPFLQSVAGRRRVLLLGDFVTRSVPDAAALWWPLSVFAHTLLDLIDQHAQGLSFTVLGLSIVLPHRAASVLFDGTAHAGRKPVK